MPEMGDSLRFLAGGGFLVVVAIAVVWEVVSYFDSKSARKAMRNAQLRAQAASKPSVKPSSRSDHTGA